MYRITISDAYGNRRIITAADCSFGDAYRYGVENCTEDETVVSIREV